MRTVVGVGTYTVSEDGRTMKSTFEDKEQSATESWVARKQPE